MNSAFSIFQWLSCIVSEETVHIPALDTKPKFRIFLLWLFLCLLLEELLEIYLLTIFIVYIIFLFQLLWWYKQPSQSRHTGSHPGDGI